jgi:hypothetical protein
MTFTKLRAFCAGLLVVSATTLAIVGSSEISGAASKSSKTIHVMTIASWDNNEVDNEDFAQVVQVAAAYVNAHGGVGTKHDKIAVATCNDLFTSTGATACARQAVANHDVAILGGLSIYDASIFPIIQPAHIPWIGNVAYSTLALSSADSFPVTAPAVLVDMAVSYEAAKSCTSTVLIDAGASTAPEYPYEVAAQELLGKSFAAHVEVTATSPDYAEFATQVADLKPSCIMFDINLSEEEQMLPALQQAGVTEPSTTIFSRHTVASALTADFPTLATGWTVGSIFTQPVQSSTWATFRNEMKNSPIDLTDPGTDENSWAATIAFGKVANEIKGTVTGPSLIAALNKTKSLSTGGLTPTIDFAKKNAGAVVSRVFNPTVTFYTSDVNGDLQPQGKSVNVVTLYNELSKYMPAS